MANFFFDLAINGQTFTTDETFQTAITVSLLSWGRARADDPVRDQTDLKGWWADAYLDNPGDTFGSRVWLLQGAKQTPETLNLADEIIRSALQWMIDDKIVASIDVSLEYQPPAAIAARIGVRRPGELAVSFVDTWTLSLAA